VAGVDAVVFRTALTGSPEAWAQALFADLDLGDRRRERRARAMVAALAAHPRDTIPQAMGSWAASKGAYRLLANEAVEPEALLKAAGRATARACRGRPRLGCVQDTTTLSFPRAPAIEGLGPVTNLDVPGLHVHTALAVGVDGQVIGLVGQQTWARPPGVSTRRLSERERPRHERESAKWQRGITQARWAFAGEPEAPRLIHLFDREGDITAVIADILAAGEGAVIRSLHNRRVLGERGEVVHAHALLAAAPVLAHTQIEIVRRHGRPARTAQVEVRALRLALAPVGRKGPDPPLVLWLVEAREVKAPAGIEPLLWRLWTTEPADEAEPALEVLALYRLRWKIEEVHLVLKSGCRIEDLRLASAAKLAKALALLTPVAARLVALRDLARREPEVPCTRVLGDSEWRALWTRIHGAPPPAEAAAPTLAQATLWIGRLGGHLGRRGDGPPGVRTLWRGLRDLAVLTELFEILHHRPP
jgi:hypothetical protein